MIICDHCGTRIDPENVKREHTAKDPYGNLTDWCPNCFNAYDGICTEVKMRLQGIYDRAVARRMQKWAARRIVLEDAEEIF